MSFGIKERIFTKKEIADTFANSLGKEKAYKEITEVTQKLKLASDIYTPPQVVLILEELSLRGGIISVIARFVRSRLIEEFKQTESFLTDIINAMPSMLLILDTELNIIKWNKVVEVIKPDFSNIENKAVMELFPQLEQYREAFDRVLTFKITSSIEKIIIKEQDKTNYFRAMIYPLNTMTSSGLVLRMDNITEQIVLEERVIQNEKLASLGVLTAGIAHEINNPVNFITASIAPLKNDINDLLKIIKCYSEINDKNYKEKIREAELFKQQIDFDLILTELEGLISSIEDGGKRASTIVKGLRTFSRLDENSVKSVDIEEGIESTIGLIRHKAKGIEIIQDYGKLPKIQCVPGKINQVIMNILSNAIDAIPDTGKIYISTQYDNKYVYIHMKDTGSGIPQDVLPHIFEPFYTTKDVGAGTGLGLSISYSIINDHKGYIDVKSNIGEGTEFTVALPVNITAI